MEEQNKQQSKFSNFKFIFAAAGAILIFLFFFSGRGEKEKILGDDIKIASYSKSGKNTGAMISLPFLKNSAKMFVSLAIDTETDGNFSADEWVIKNMPLSPSEKWNSNLSFKTSQNISGNKKVKVVLSKARVDDSEFKKLLKGAEVKILEVTVSEQDLTEIFGEETTDNPDETMKQGDTAAPNTTVANPTGVPDFGQRKAECAPTVAANGLYSLAIKNGAADKLPEDPKEMIDGLKGDMLWTNKSGVLPDNFVDGKNKWAVTHGLPIKTEKIGDSDGRGTLNEIKTALQKGAAVEMRIRFADADLKVIGGHIVSVVKVREENGKTLIDVHDPASPTGTDTYVVEANTLENYPYHDGYTVVGWGFSQMWEGAPMGGNLDVMTDAELKGIREFAGEQKTIKAIKYNNKYIPLSEVHVGKGEHCDSKEESYPHWHSNNGTFALATDGSKVYDNNGCGYGKIKDVPEVEIQTP